MHPFIVIMWSIARTLLFCVCKFSQGCRYTCTRVSLVDDMERSTFFHYVLCHWFIYMHHIRSFNCKRVVYWTHKQDQHCKQYPQPWFISLNHPCQKIQFMGLSTHAAANFWFPTQTSEAEGPYYTTPQSTNFSWRSATRYWIINTR